MRVIRPNPCIDRINNLRQPRRPTYRSRAEEASKGKCLKKRGEGGEHKEAPEKTIALRSLQMTTFLPDAKDIPKDY